MEANSYALLIAPFMGWIVAQFIKFVFTLRKDGVSLHDAIQSGGMPSSHSAFMCSITTAVGLVEGVSSALFALSVAVTAIIMYDAIGVRRTTGEQTIAIKTIVKKVNVKTPLLLHDARGHTPLEVVVGAVVGTITGLLTVVIL